MLEVNRFSDETHQQLIDMFNLQRTREQEELLSSCELFLKEIESETAKGNFSYHEVEENEADFAKLKRWLKKIMRRDFFGCPLSKEAKRRLEECEQKFTEFRHRVYITEGATEGKIKLDDML